MLNTFRLKKYCLSLFSFGIFAALQLPLPTHSLTQVNDEVTSVNPQYQLPNYLAQLRDERKIDNYIIRGTLQGCQRKQTIVWCDILLISVDGDTDIAAYGAYYGPTESTIAYDAEGNGYLATLRTSNSKETDRSVFLQLFKGAGVKLIATFREVSVRANSFSVVAVALPGNSFIRFYNVPIR